MDIEIIGGVMMITLIILLFIKGIIIKERK